MAEREWQLRPLQETYTIVYMDAIHVRVRESGSVSTRAVHVVIRGAVSSHKEILGFWIDQHEGAKFWLMVLDELKARGLADILIAIVDGLKGFPEALRTAFPKTTVQTCIRHLVRHSLACASPKERKPLADALKPVYQAVNVDQAEARLTEFEQSELGKKYPDVARSWRRRWEEVIPFLAFSPLIRKAIYTTNAIESLNASVRRAVQVRGHFTSEGAVK